MPKEGTYLGFDYGTVFIGVSVGQTISKTARPLAVVKNHKGKPNFSMLTPLVKEWRPVGLVLGLPLNEGKLYWLSEAVMDFAKQLRQQFALPVYFTDESLTTREAKAHPAFQKNVSKQKNDMRSDALAAALILEHWFQAPYHNPLAATTGDPE